MAYPTIFRQRALAALRNGKTKTEVNDIYGLSNNVLKEWEELEKETGSLESRPRNHQAHKIDREKLRRYCKENPFATHKEAAAYFGVSESGIRSAKKVLGITRKKRQNTIRNEMNKNERNL